MSRVRGWCPTLHEPMRTGDGLLLRIKPPGSTVRADQARLIASFGRPVELTSRGNLQLRGFSPADAAAFAAAMVGAGLASADPAAERRRTVLLAPGCGPRTREVASALEAALEAATDLSDLPPKFGFTVEDGASMALDAVRADVRLRAERDDWLVKRGERRIRSTDPVGAAIALAQNAGPVAEPAASAPVPPGAIGPVPGGCGLGAWFGQVDLARLAELAERHGDGTIHLTPWRAVVLPGADAAAIRGDAEAGGLIVDPADPRLRVIACTGKPGCASASVDARRDAAMLAGLGVGGVWHVSGCGKGCAHPHRADVTLVGEAGRYNLVLGGSPHDAPVRRGLDPAEAVASAGRLRHDAAA